MVFSITFIKVCFNCDPASVFKSGGNFHFMLLRRNCFVNVFIILLYISMMLHRSKLSVRSIFFFEIRREWKSEIKYCIYISFCWIVFGHVNKTKWLCGAYFDET